ncbi:MAG: HesA/MoeB/ThiF family protein, partial [Promethearchaeota archaeon]
MNNFRGNDDNEVSSNKSDLEGNLVGLTKGELERYERQILRIGVEGQKILKSKSVLQVGAGGLGSPLAYYLVAAGVGRLIIIDDDKVSLSNLNRQILYNVDDLGKMKAEVAKRKLEFLNPEVKIDAISGRLTKENYRDYIKGVDYLIDASDNLKTK